MVVREGGEIRQFITLVPKELENVITKLWGPFSVLVVSWLKPGGGDIGLFITLVPKVL